MIDFNRLFKLRAAVARIGEMDLARWWNTQGLLGPRGAVVLKRGFPSTHFFTQARIVFAVARSRCHELFDPPGCMTLWNLPAEVEDQFEEHWQGWLDESANWSPFFEQLAGSNSDNLLTFLGELELVSAAQIEAVSNNTRLCPESAKKKAEPR